MGCEPDDVSMLHAARYAHAAGGLDRLLDVEDGAQQDRFPGGTQQIAEAAPPNWTPGWCWAHRCGASNATGRA